MISLATAEVGHGSETFMQRDDLLLRVREGEKWGLRLRPKEKYAGNWRRLWMCEFNQFIPLSLLSLGERGWGSNGL